MTRRGTALAAAVGLAACAGPQWTKPGVAADVAAADYAACRDEERQAMRSDSNIQADILASRSRDWELDNTLTAHKDSFAAEDQQRADEVLAACMHLRGYTLKQ